MTNEEKITHIRTAAMEEARAEANAIVKQHEDALRSVFEQHQIEAVGNLVDAIFDGNAGHVFSLNIGETSQRHGGKRCALAGGRHRCQ